MAPIKIYGFEASPPFRAVLTVAKIVGVDVEKKIIDFANKEYLTESFIEINPNHSLPVMDDNGFVIWESRAIATYLVQQYAADDQLYPKDLKKRTVVDNMLHFDNATFCTFQLLEGLPRILCGEKPTPFGVERMNDRLKIVDRVLSRSKFAAGDQVTIADISMLTTLGIPVALKFDIDSHPNIARYLAETPSKIPHFEEINQKGEQELKDFIAKLL